jgi:cytochrome c-type biogenesis protein CcmH/NrfG
VHFDEQRVVLNDRISQDSTRVRDWFALARLYARMSLWSDARRTVLSGLRRAPADPEGRKLLAEVDRSAD